MLHAGFQGLSCVHGSDKHAELQGVCRDRFSYKHRLLAALQAALHTLANPALTPLGKEVHQSGFIQDQHLLSLPSPGGAAACAVQALVCWGVSQEPPFPAPALLQHQLHLCPSTSLVDFTKTIHPQKHRARAPAVLLMSCLQQGERKTLLRAN